MFGVGEGVADHDLRHTRDGDDIAGDGLVGRVAFDADGGEQFGDLCAGDHGKPVDFAHPSHLLALAEAAVVDADQRETAEERRGVQVGDQRLQRRFRVALRRRNVFEQNIEQGVEVLALGVLAVGGLDRAGHSGSAGRVQGRQAEGMLSGRLRLGV